MMLFIINAIGLGIGLAMDAFSVSLANGLHEPEMKPSRMCLIAGIFGLFQMLMPLVGWICVRAAAEAFRSFRRLIPWIALILLLYIGGKMLIEGLKGEDGDAESTSLDLKTLLLQGIATSIDALSVGFAIAEYNAGKAFSASLIIGVVTFIICLAGIRLGRLFGTRLAGRASVFGGVILILIGLEIFFG